MSDREKWLNGWERNHTGVLIGTGIHCAGCGKTRGVICVVFEEGYQPPKMWPDWPFDEESCPLCEALGYSVVRQEPPAPSIGERLAAFKAAKQKAGYYSLTVGQDGRAFMVRPDGSESQITGYQEGTEQ